MIYETTIKHKDFVIEIEFNSETEIFNYEIKERKSINAKSKSTDKESRDNTGTNSGSESTESTNRDTDGFLE